jgi:hypothetical protein
MVWYLVKHRDNFTLLYLHALQVHYIQVPLNYFLQMQHHLVYNWHHGQMEVVPLSTLWSNTGHFLETIGTGSLWITMLLQNSCLYETSSLQHGMNFASLHTMMLGLHRLISALPPLLLQEVGQINMFYCG